MNEDTAVVVTAYCDGQNPEEKRKMAKTLVKSLKEKGHYVCMTTHSVLDEETQSYCDAYLYDKNNPWQINGQPTRPNHAVAELILMHTANDFVQKYGFKNVFKMTFDLSPNLDVHEIINRSKSKNKRLVTCRNNTDLGTLCFFSDVGFLRETFQMDQIHRISPATNYSVEPTWYQLVLEKGLIDETCDEYPLYHDFLNIPHDEPMHYSEVDDVHLTNKMHEYNFNL
jgi:hypothetical protein